MMDAEGRGAPGEILEEQIGGLEPLIVLLEPGLLARAEQGDGGYEVDEIENECQRLSLIEGMGQAERRDQQGDDQDAAQRPPVAAREVPLQSLILVEEDEVVEGLDLHRDSESPGRFDRRVGVGLPTATARQSSGARSTRPSGTASAGVRPRR